MTTRHFSKIRQRIPELPALTMAAVAMAWCVALWMARAWFTGDEHYFYLVYNLALAAIPLLLGTAAIRVRHRAGRAVLLACWLAFFPNAPYLITDLIHLRPRPECPFWFDWLLFVSMAGGGLLLAVISLAQVHGFLRKHLQTLHADGLVLAVVSLSAFGIYLGRFLRWNSWDVVTQPGSMIGELASLVFQPFDHPRMLAYSFGVAVVLGLSYFGPLVAFRSLLNDER